MHDNTARRDAVLAEMDPTNPETIQALIDLNREIFGGFTMVEATSGEDGAGAGAGAEADKGAADKAATDKAATDKAAADKAAADKAATGADEALGESGKKALAAERDRADKAEREAATLRKQIEDANKTAEQLAADKLTAAETRAVTAEAKALRYDVAAKAGLSLALAPRLSGSNETEMLADAESLKALMGGGGSGDQKPKPDKSAGQSQDKGQPTSLRAAIEAALTPNG